MPEALTQWRFMGFAHDRQLRSGFLTDTAVTAKDLMVQPNPPRFVREGDVIEFTVKVSNQSATRQTGKVSLTLSDAWTLASSDTALGNTSPEQSFDVASQESQHVLLAADHPGWLRVPHLQGRGSQRPAQRRRGGLPAGAEPADPGDRVAAAARSAARRPRSSSSPSCWNRANRTPCGTRA